MRYKTDWAAFGVALGMVIIGGFVGGIAAGVIIKLIF